jgi:hypothetical protein
MAQVMEGLLDELALALEDGLIVGIEADDEAGEHPEAAFLNDAHLLDEVLAQVLKFLRGAFQSFGGGRLDADKTYMKLARDHGGQQLGPVGEIDGGFGVEGETGACAVSPQALSSGAS